MRTLLAQFRYEQRSYWRSPLSVVSSIGFTPIFIFLIAGVTGETGGALQRFLPGVVTISAMSICVTGVAVNLSYRRDQNILKRFYATPVSPWTILVGVVLSATLTTLVVALASVAFVATALDVHLAVGVASLLAGVALLSFALAWLGCALSAVPSQSVVAVANLVVFPALFVSGTMFPLDDSVWYAQAGRLLPPYFARQLVAPALGVDLGGTTPAASLAGLAAWALVAAVVGARTFRWNSAAVR